ncbi:conserved oligomeric Golgi complex subunit 2 [Coccinella septempunctata]|uniref:conserved oligomeric Golgi complex subunit 2 n=1 Tax=Coccinella septempunctata TaxID=41139 RepID=UPI001D064203|nr:conserved oligomeric Golgi complex subunit 2 [Coccinella septempunctata]
MSPLDNFPWKDTFFQENFSIDQCLSKLTQKANLETLKSYLKNYGDELHRQMAEILKTETEAIVNLAEYLTNLNAKIDDLSTSLSQLQEELSILHTLIKNAEIDYRKTLEDKRMNETQKSHLIAELNFISISLYVDNIIRNIQSNDMESLINLERAIYKYSFQRNYLLELGVSETKGTKSGLENKLLNMIHQQFLRALKDKDSNSIARCLRMYSNLDKEKEAEEFYQLRFVRTALQPMYSEKNLDKFNQDINKIYNDTLNFLYNDMKILDDVLKENTDLQDSFNFILNSFWVEVDRQCRKGLPHITAPGNPELFQKRFVSTWNLLTEIAKKCGRENMIKENPSFQDHIKRFNLPVYFEIRFQQIASQFETDLMIKPNDSSIHNGENDFGFKLKITLNLYVALKKCFDSNVFIDQLADHFLKFSMFLLSRYIMWFKKALEQPYTDMNWEYFIMNSLVDFKKILKLLGDKEALDSDENLYSIFPNIMKPVIVKVFENNNKMITQFSVYLSDHLASLKVNEISEQLQNVTAIPRLFRRTNRSPPKEASTYMFEAVKPILQFIENYAGGGNDEICNPLLDKVILRVTKQYCHLVQDVLQSVFKTEESLRRLKSRNIVSLEETSSETMTDEMKIREQIKLDINYFILKLRPVSSSSSTDEALNQLEKNISIS